MGIETLKVQLTLNADNPKEKEIIDYISNSGKRSGLPKQLLIRGYDDLMGRRANCEAAEVERPTSAPNLDQYIS